LILDFIIINVIKKMLFTKRYSVALVLQSKCVPNRLFVMVFWLTKNM